MITVSDKQKRAALALKERNAPMVAYRQAELPAAAMLEVGLEMRHVREAGYTPDELKREEFPAEGLHGPWPAEEMRGTDWDLKSLKDGGYSAMELIEGGWAPEALVENEVFTIRELLLEVVQRKVGGHTDFDPESLTSSVIAPPLVQKLKEVGEELPVPVVLELDRKYPEGPEGAMARVRELLEEIRPGEADYIVQWHKSNVSPESQYLYARLTGQEIRALVARPEQGGRSPVFRAWLDFPIRPLTNRSYSTVKADAARQSFGALGEGVVWAVMDSGVDSGHRHFAKYENLKLELPVEHKDFTGLTRGSADPLHDEFGHGTHVAGTIAGERSGNSRYPIQAWVRHRDEQEEITYRRPEIARLCGMAPKVKIVSLKVLDENADGLASNLMAAIGYIQQLNAYGRELKIHGVNMSVGYGFDAEWYACGQSPLCVEVDRLVRSGVVVVVAAGNTGYWPATGGGLTISINDPGNAERAITVGSTHRDRPYRYGVSYFSSKGPTGDGRLKPDLLAPGERILACAAGDKRSRVEQKLGGNRVCEYLEDSGTSMAAAHVSGVIAAFLSIRPEFIGQPERVKKIFLESASDLGRERYLQGHGLVDLMRAIQSI